MISYKLVGDDEEQKWDRLAMHPMQSWAWGNFRQSGQKITRLGRYEDGELVKIFLIVWTKIKLTPWSFGYIPMGPMPDKNDLDQIALMARSSSGIGVRIEPLAMLDESPAFSDSRLVPGRNLFKPETYWLKLSRSEQELLSAMHPKCRYNIRLATKKGVQINETAGDVAIANYLKLLFGKTGKRQKIYSHSEAYHARLWRELSLRGIARLFEARLGDRVLAMWMIFVWKKFAYYAYGGFDEEMRHLMAPVLGLWKIALILKRNGYEVLDLWGREDGKGFSRFKEQFTPALVTMVGTMDLPINKFLYELFRLVEDIRWKFLKLVR